MANRKKAKDFHHEIKDLINQGLTNPEIAEELKLTRSQVAIYSQRFLGGNPNYLKKKTKHKHLRKDVMTYFLDHSQDECIDKFGISKSEFKSIMTVGYRDQNLSHLRKDKRRRDAWSSEELRFLLKWSGVISRDEINSILKRGNSSIVIKEKLQKLNLCSKNVNGLTFSQFKKLFKSEPIYYLKTCAGNPGPSGCFSDSRWKLVPWCHIEEMLVSGFVKHSESIVLYIMAMAKFQRWVHGKDYWKSLTSTPFLTSDILKSE